MSPRDEQLLDPRVRERARALAGSAHEAVFAKVQGGAEFPRALTDVVLEAYQGWKQTEPAEVAEAAIEMACDTLPLQAKIRTWREERKARRWWR
jgi:hypothetical protein